MVQFKTVTLRDKAWVDEIVMAENSPSADYNFGNIYIWDKHYRQLICRLGGRMLTKLRYEGKPTFVFPIGTGPLRPAIEALREENLNLQQEKRLLLTRLGLPGDYLEEKPKCSRCNDTGFLGSEVCSCLRGYYAREQNKELSGLLDLGSQCFENFNFDYYSSVPDSDLGVSPRTAAPRTMI